MGMALVEERTGNVFNDFDINVFAFFFKFFCFEIEDEVGLV